ncbi:MAG: purine-binding chemotaxis protein CheW [Gammaproteobacteria bacterium]|nr:purine-binding chemotaxis protein CheW [Gammaproteobacteria bacterium]NIR28325.1 purine-binding chemotaxis protein CheW [Gammaproteobacteria bacterium]NIR96739.1 purine-binding chemotaxis protein CheW [Gammaproteobacteria bacterium]NIT62441.1 purine-binding chemotaxis protein CheW [Gammaproteobacteria bacterium]NIV19374.1 chemotaxis protein CheW [Gammaproteobacteria bacterium]
MSRGSDDSPVELLREVERRSRRRAAPLPKQEDVRDQWSGIGFRVGDLRVVAALGEVTEILALPVLTRVPGAKSWVLGIANVRGNLLPIMDLDGYLHGRRTGITKRSRVLVINRRGVYAGLLVDEVLALRHFEEDDKAADIPEADPAVRPYLDRGYISGDESWPVFSVRRLAESPLFLQVAV